MEEIASGSAEDLMNTDIEELRDAAESIQSLQRVLKLPQELPSNQGLRSTDKTRLFHAFRCLKFVDLQVDSFKF